MYLPAKMHIYSILKGSDMKKRMFFVIGLVCAVVFGFSAIAAAITSQYYNFSNNVPPMGFVNSSNKKLTTALTTSLYTCGNDKYVAMKAIRVSDGANITYGKNYPIRDGISATATCRLIPKAPGTYYTLVSSSYTGQTVYLGLQAYGNYTVTATGYWHF